MEASKSPRPTDGLGRDATDLAIGGGGGAPGGGGAGGAGATGGAMGAIGLKNIIHHHY